MKARYAVAAFWHGALVQDVKGWQHEGTCRLLARSWMNGGVIRGSGDAAALVIPHEVMVFKVDEHGKHEVLASLTEGGWSDGWH